MLPLGFGYLAGMLIILFVQTDREWEAEQEAASDGGDDQPDQSEGAEQGVAS
jgi:hypothetical protein